jgi:hypothetical protein
MLMTYEAAPISLNFSQLYGYPGWDVKSAEVGVENMRRFVSGDFLYHLCRIQARSIFQKVY